MPNTSARCPLEISVRPLDEWTFECSLDISVCPMDEWSFEYRMDISVRPMVEWTLSDSKHSSSLLSTCCQTQPDYVITASLAL